MRYESGGTFWSNKWVGQPLMLKEVSLKKMQPLVKGTLGLCPLPNFAHCLTIPPHDAAPCFLPSPFWIARHKSLRHTVSLETEPALEIYKIVVQAKHRIGWASIGWAGLVLNIRLCLFKLGPPEKMRCCFRKGKDRPIGRV